MATARKRAKYWHQPPHAAPEALKEYGPRKFVAESEADNRSIYIWRDRQGHRNRRFSRRFQIEMGRGKKVIQWAAWSCWRPS